MCERLTKENLKLFYYPLQALLARENTITMHNGHKQVNAESIDFYKVAVPNAALSTRPLVQTKFKTSQKCSRQFGFLSGTLFTNFFSFLFYNSFVWCYGTPAEVWGLGPKWIYGLDDPIYFGASPPANGSDLESLWGPCPTT